MLVFIWDWECIHFAPDLAIISYTALLHHISVYIPDTFVLDLVRIYQWMILITNKLWLQAVEYVAKSFGDNPSDRVAGRDAVLKIVADSTGVVKDADTLDLYEYACSDAKMDYPETIGVLRSRLVKAMPKDRSSSLRCLWACIYNSDWQHAQEVIYYHCKRCSDVF